MDNHPANEHGMNCGENEKINMDDWKEPKIDKIDIPKNDEEIMNRFDECDEDDFFHGYLKAKSDFAKVIAERDARIKELEAERYAFESALRGEIEDHKAIQAKLSRTRAIDTISPLTLEGCASPLTIGDEIVPLTINEGGE